VCVCVCVFIVRQTVQQLCEKQIYVCQLALGGTLSYELDLVRQRPPLRASLAPCEMTREIQTGHTYT